MLSNNFGVEEKTPFNVVMIDWPLAYKDKNTGGGFNSGSANKYKTMQMDDIIETIYCLNQVLEKDCIIFMWATVPLARECMDIVKEFEGYKFRFVGKHFWNKKRKKLGMGRDFRNEVEELLILKRGKIKPFPVYASNRWLIKAGKHSAKPIQFMRLAETWGWNSFGKRLNLLELFARRRVNGWTQLGYAINKKDVRASLRAMTK